MAKVRMAPSEADTRFATRLIAALRAQRPDAVPDGASEELARMAPERITGVLMRQHTVSPTELRAALLALGISIPNIPGYRLDAPVGRGGNGVVWRGEQLPSGVAVAIKISRSTSPVDDVRFLREAKTAAEIRHSRIVPLLDVGVINGLRYLILEFQAGGDAHDLALRHGGTLAPLQALRIVAQAAQGLHALHAVGLVHRDCNPGNIFIDADGHARLGDLGLVRRRDEQVTQTGVAIGTPGYLSPEQALGDAVDARSDIFSLGATFFAMLVGKAPFVADTPLATIAAAATGSVPDPRSRGVDCGLDIAAIIRCATARNATARYDSAQEFVADCDAVLSGNRPVIALRRRGGHRPVGKPLGSARSWSIAWPILAAGLLVSLVAFTAGRWIGLRLSTPDRRDLLAAADARSDSFLDGWQFYVERFPRGHSVAEGRAVLALAEQIPVLRTEQGRIEQRLRAEQRSVMDGQRDVLLAELAQRRVELAALQAEHVRLLEAIATHEAAATVNERRRATVSSAMIDRARQAAPPGCEVLLECKRAARLIIIDPAEPQRLLIAHMDGLAMSEDDGTTWQEADPLRFTPPHSNGFTISPYGEVRRAMWAGDRLWLDAGGMGMKLAGLLSLDRGRSFRLIPVPPFLHDHQSINSLGSGSIMLPNGHLIAGATAPDHFVRSVDAGETWQITRLFHRIVAALPDEKGALMLVGSQGVSRNEGRTWSEGQSLGVSSWDSISHLTWDMHGVIGIGHGLRMYTRSGVGGSKIAEELGNLLGAVRLSTNPQWLYAVSEKLGLVHSADGGKRWLRAAPALQAATAATAQSRWVPLALTPTTPPQLLYQGSDGMIRRLTIDDRHADFFPDPIRP